MAAKVGTSIHDLRRGTILGFDRAENEFIVGLDISTNTRTPQQVRVPLYTSFSGPDGIFAGGLPETDAPVVIGRGPGGEWFIVSFIPTNGSSEELNFSLRENRYLIQNKNNIKLFVDPTSIEFGDDENRVIADPIKNIFNNNFGEHSNFSEAKRQIDGIIRRDLNPNSNRGVVGDTLDSNTYRTGLREIAFDPSSPVSAQTLDLPRNVPFVENREVTYELAYSFNPRDFNTESQQFQPNPPPQNFSTIKSRRNSRADVLSLNLTCPNYLIEEIKGTVVDIYGNILDLNRSILPIGTDNFSLRNSDNQEVTYNSIREQLRKSIAYHFEINSRKGEDVNLANIADYSKRSSRFSFDVDKEGQFKINIPSSSEVGNIPLLTRYENVSTLRAARDNTNPDVLERNVLNQDIAAESFATAAPIRLIGSSAREAKAEPSRARQGKRFPDQGFNVPIDRVTQAPINYGTAYHDITAAAELHQRENPVETYYPDSRFNTPEFAPPLPFLVSPEITISGENANAGGRSGSVNLDGFISVNIGANTIDRQSMWIDTAGGVVGRYGRDLRDVSYAGKFDGDVLIEIGGPTVSNDSRFNGPDGPINSLRAGAIDIRVLGFANGDLTEFSIFRIDQSGITITTPGQIDFSATQDIRLYSVSGNVILDGEKIITYADDRGGGREINRNGTSI